MTGRTLALVTALALAIPAPAAFAQDPFGPIPPAPPEEPAPAPDADADDGGGLTREGTLAIAGGALLLVSGLAAFILRDARRRAPGKPGAPVREPMAGRHPGSRAPKQQRKQRSRAKARAARQARKRAR